MGSVCSFVLLDAQHGEASRCCCVVSLPVLGKQRSAAGVFLLLECSSAVSGCATAAGVRVSCLLEKGELPPLLDVLGFTELNPQLQSFSFKIRQINPNSVRKQSQADCSSCNRILIKM